MTKFPTRSLLLATTLAGLVACSVSPTYSGSAIEKPEGGKADMGPKLCQLLGAPIDCDVCDIAGWYGDGECDEYEFCGQPDPDCRPPREPNPVCDSRLDGWMFDCIDRNVRNGESLEDATGFCVGGVEDGEPIEIAGICDSGDDDCFIDLADNAPACAEAIGLELAGRAPNPACDGRLDDWMYDCIDRNLGAGESLEDAMDFCVGGVEDGEPMATDGICAFDDDDCFLDLADNAPACGEAIGLELAGRAPNPACDDRLDFWMYSCIVGNVDDGETLEDAARYCVGGVEDGEPIEIEGICVSGDDDCFIDLADNAPACAEAISLELVVRTPNPVCDSRLDGWMVECIDGELDGGADPKAAVEVCVGGVEDGEPIEIAGICVSGDDDCFIELGENALICAIAIADEPR